MVNRKLTPIPMVDLKAEIQLLKNPIVTNIVQTIDSGQFILGEKGEKLERKIADYVKASYALGVANGTDALQLALKVLNIGRGDEVITTPFTFFATGEAILLEGATPVFVDIEANTYNIDPSKITDAITTKTKAIIVVHLYGQAANMKEIMAIAKAHNLKVIEDACQAIGTEYMGKKVGAIGDIGCFSFFPSKNLGAFGDAGMIVTNEKRIYDQMKQLRNHGSDEKYYHHDIGMNSRLDELQAAILLVKLQYLNTFLYKRKQIATRYTNHLHHCVKTPPIVKDRTHTFHQYCIEVEKRDELAYELTTKGISSAIYYPLPLHLQKACRYLSYEKGDFPNAERAAQKVLALPISPMLSIEQQNYIIRVINDFFKKE